MCDRSFTPCLLHWGITHKNKAWSTVSVLLWQFANSCTVKQFHRRSGLGRQRGFVVANFACISCHFMVGLFCCFKPPLFFNQSIMVLSAAFILLIPLPPFILCLSENCRVLALDVCLNCKQMFFERTGELASYVWQYVVMTTVLIIACLWYCSLHVYFLGCFFYFFCMFPISI